MERLLPRQTSRERERLFVILFVSSPIAAALALVQTPLFLFLSRRSLTTYVLSLSLRFVPTPLAAGVLSLSLFRRSLIVYVLFHHLPLGGKISVHAGKRIMTRGGVRTWEEKGAGRHKHGTSAEVLMNSII